MDLPTEMGTCSHLQLGEKMERRSLGNASDHWQPVS